MTIPLDRWRPGDPPMAYPDITIGYRGPTTIFSAQTVPGEEWLIEHVGGTRCGRGFVIASEHAEAAYGAALAAGLVARRIA